MNKYTKIKITLGLVIIISISGTITVSAIRSDHFLIDLLAALYWTCFALYGIAFLFLWLTKKERESKELNN